MRLRAILSCLMLYCTSLVAEQYYPQRVQLLHRDDGVNYRFSGAPFSKRNPTVEYSNNGEQITLALRSSDSLRTLQIQADSILSAIYNASTWFVFVTRHDSLSCVVISPTGSMQSQFIAVVSSPTLLSSDSSHVSIVSGAFVYCLVVNGTSGRVTPHRIDSQQKRIVYAYYVDGRYILGSLLSGDVASIERIDDGRAHNVGAVNVIPGLLASDATSIAALSSRNGQLQIQTLRYRSPNEQPITTILPADFFEPLCVSTHADTVTIVFSNGVIRTCGADVISADHVMLRDFVAPIDVWLQGTDLLLCDRTHRVILVVNDDTWFRFRQVFDIIEHRGLSIVAAVILLFLGVRLQRYRRHLRDVLELGSNSISFVVDRNMRIQRMNSRARALFDMDASTPLGRVLKYYCHGESQRVIESFVSSALITRTPQRQKLVMKARDNDTEIIFTAQPLHSLTGAFDGLVISGVDITEELERKRIVNWAQLAHDMQTNLSIIKLNAEQLSEGIAPEREDQRLRIVHQASLLLHRVRDIVSIGRDEQLHLSEVDVRTICLGVVKEFDDSSLGDIRFVTPERNMLVRIDTPKMQRALRNAVENAIRALHNKRGEITFDYSITKASLWISVADNGVGMDEQTRENFFRPYFSNYRQFGGTGIGTMIMQRAVQLHGGRIDVVTAAGAGTTIIFHLPPELYVRG